MGDNTDIVILREASFIIQKKAAQVLKNLSEFAIKYKSLPCLAYTHLQPLSLQLSAKRATLWMYELSQDMDNLDYQLANLSF